MGTSQLIQCHTEQGAESSKTIPAALSEFWSHDCSAKP